MPSSVYLERCKQPYVAITIDIQSHAKVIIEVKQKIELSVTKCLVPSDTNIVTNCRYFLEIETQTKIRNIEFAN